MTSVDVHTPSGNIPLPVDTSQETLLALHADHAKLQHKALPKDLTRADVYADVTVSLEATSSNFQQQTMAKELQRELTVKLQNRYTCPDKSLARFVLQVYITQIQKSHWTGKRHVTVEWFVSSVDGFGATEIVKSGRSSVSSSPDPWSRHTTALAKAVKDELVHEIPVHHRHQHPKLDEKEEQRRRDMVRKKSSYDYDYAKHIYDEH